MLLTLERTVIQYIQLVRLPHLKDCLPTNPSHLVVPLVVVDQSRPNIFDIEFQTRLAIYKLVEC